MTGRPEDAEDVVQEAFVRAYRQLSRFEARSNFATWLYRIAFNCAIDYMRARRRPILHLPLVPAKARRFAPLMPAKAGIQILAGRGSRLRGATVCDGRIPAYREMSG